MYLFQNYICMLMKLLFLFKSRYNHIQKVFILIIIISMFKQQKGKSTFLQKKNQEKQKVQDQQKHKLFISKLQKNIRAYIVRKRILQQAQQQTDLKMPIFMSCSLNSYSKQSLNDFLQSLRYQNEGRKNYYYEKYIIKNLQIEAYSQSCIHLLSLEENVMLRKSIFNKQKYIYILSSLIKAGKASTLLNLSIKYLNQENQVQKIMNQSVINLMLQQFSEHFLEIENVYGSRLSEKTIQILLSHLNNKGYTIDNINLTSFLHLILHQIRKLNNKYDQKQELKEDESTLCYCIEQFMRCCLSKHEDIVKLLIQQNQNLLCLVEDEELLSQIENKMRRNQHYEEYANQFLQNIKKIITNPYIIKIFEKGQNKNINRLLLKIINELSILFQDKRLIFINELLSSDTMIKSMKGSNDPIYYQGIKMKLLSMDDKEFMQFNILSNEDWKRIISSCINISKIKIEKHVEKINSVNTNLKKELIPFKKRNNDELQLRTLLDILNNLYKKVLRTSKLNAEVFVDYNLSNLLYNFLFGKGAQKMQYLLKEIPFIFSFEARMNKFKELIKNDKKNYNRTLFTMDEIDEDLIITVRRGHQFNDAFEACMKSDLRQKYKIVFFNEQGLEQVGIDGGGIIKQFINKVLKSAFSDYTGLFLQTPLNQVIPNPYSEHTVQYQFIGKLIGKAVYQTINIDQKFAQPFLNLVIGRQNMFQDIKYIDPEIYNGLVYMKHTKENIEEMEQTFVINDKLPNGITRAIDLLLPNKAPSKKQVKVTNENKLEFIMRYADFKCNIQMQEKTKLFRRGFLKVMKPQWLTMFSNQELNMIISGSQPDFSVKNLRINTVYNDYHEKDQTIIYFWQVLEEMNGRQKSQFLLYVTSCSRPPTLGFQTMKPKICIARDQNITHLPTANTCMNVLRLPNYKNKPILKQKLFYAMNARAGFQFE